MKIIYKSSLPCLIAMLWLFAACSPQYGAHFSPSKQSPSVATKKNVEQVAPLVTEQPAAAPIAVEARAEKTGATEVATDVAAPAVATTPAAPEMSAKEQRKVIRELRSKLKGMTKAEREAFKIQVRNQLKQQQAAMNVSEDDQRDGGGGAAVSTVLLVILAILIPPLAVFLHQGAINTKFWISLVLTLLFVLPGIIYSLLVVLDVV